MVKRDLCRGGLVLCRFVGRLFVERAHGGDTDSGEWNIIGGVR